MMASVRILGMGLLVALLAGCGVADRVGNRLGDTWAGDLLGNQERVRVTIDSDESVNPDADGKPLSVVVRIYQLTEQSSFATASPRQLWSDGESILGNSLLAQREVTLLPGEEKVDTATLKPSAQYVGVAAFFRNTVSDDWHVIFDAEELRNDGLLSASEGVKLHLVGDRVEVVRGHDLLGN
ncbi:type VI secretion system lipoprotein TssJ [Salinicola halimionae]|uniref:type VI secretion system lipoprotein TssJ n=1 Tax=Salinicola halimionae TaxID=1949081 RepID=UPI000DA181A4|nr:type VI secretion system lipoprotein TssJ [Salinicola halimionae]